MTANEIDGLVAEELRSIADPDRRAALSSLLVEPQRHLRSWAYGPGKFECWTVARDDSRATVLIYSRGAFADPWGFVACDSDDLGMDSQWFSTLDDAFIGGLWRGPLPPDYEVS